MKSKILLLTLIFVHSTHAQTPSYREKLFYTCKIWGFVKYFHSEVSTCQVNWDSVLVSHLPAVKNVISEDDFNNELIAMLNAAGPMDLASTPSPDTLPAELKRNLNFGWLQDNLLREDVRTMLDTVKNNFRPHNQCWVRNNVNTPNVGWLIFPHDSLMINSNTDLDYPDEFTRLLILFKYWNIINYFNPYNYVLDVSCDSLLFNHVTEIADAPAPRDFYLLIKKIAKGLNDAHAEGLTASSNIPFPEYYCPSINLTYTGNKYIVCATTYLSGLRRGDELVAINGLTPQQMEDSLRPYVSAGDSSVFHRFMCSYLLTGPMNSQVSVTYADSSGNLHTFTPYRTRFISDPWFTNYYPNDTLDNVKWKLFSCGTGYVNMGNLELADVSTMYNNLRNSPALIFDLRNYPNGTAWQIGNLMLPGWTCFAKLTIPSVTYPGTFYWENDFLGFPDNQNAYQGKVIILHNEQTQSQAEYSCMILEAMPDVVKVGSQTAGADGNISYFRLAQDLSAGFTNLGVYYPNGDSTQRIGIVPDSLVYRTQEGIRKKRDEVLEKALEIAGCPLARVDDLTSGEALFNIFPNPNRGVFELESNWNGKQEIKVIDLSGREVYRQTISEKGILDLGFLNPGVYNIHIRQGNQSSSKKIVLLD